jgi:hypothetical protein
MSTTEKLALLREATEAVRLAASYREARKALRSLGASFNDSHTFVLGEKNFSLPRGRSREKAKAKPKSKGRKG